MTNNNYFHWKDLEICDESEYCQKVRLMSGNTSTDKVHLMFLEGENENIRKILFRTEKGDYTTIDDNFFHIKHIIREAGLLSFAKNEQGSICMTIPAFYDNEKNCMNLSINIEEAIVKWYENRGYLFDAWNILEKNKDKKLWKKSEPAGITYESILNKPFAMPGRIISQLTDFKRFKKMITSNESIFNEVKDYLDSIEGIIPQELKASLPKISEEFLLKSIFSALKILYLVKYISIGQISAELGHPVVHHNHYIDTNVNAFFSVKSYLETNQERILKLALDQLMAEVPETLKYNPMLCEAAKVFFQSISVSIVNNPDKTLGKTKYNERYMNFMLNSI